ncbi:MAG: ABC transporter permease [bacterium]|nr:ABC transporter permease [bacterium]
MKWRKNLRLSTTAMWRSRWRTLLSTSGMAIGIAAVAVVFALGAGAERALQEILEQMGRNLLVVNAGRTETDALRGGSRQVETLELSDWRAILEQVPSVERAAPVTSSGLDLRFGRLILQTTVTGSTAELRQARNYTLVTGRFIDDDDVGDTRRVAVIGAHVARELFFGEWPIGERLLVYPPSARGAPRVRGVPFTIIGVLEKKGASPYLANEDNQVIVPVSTAQRRLLNVDYLDRIFVQAVSKPALDSAERDVRALLRRRHRPEAAAGGVAAVGDDFEIQDQDAMLAAQAETGDSFSRLVSGLAALALGLGGVGLLAVSLLSVRERYGEIGLRLAVGALRRDVLLQFLAEAVLVAVLGGLVGLTLGGAGILLGERLSGWPLALTWRSVVYPFVISLAVAVVFGAYPALRAARLDPIVALRSK